MELKKIIAIIRSGLLKDVEGRLMATSKNMNFES
jgi:hypothetical protein